MTLRIRIAVSASLCAIGLAAIVYLSTNVIRDIRLLDTAQSDNVQWTLSQTEVEFLKFDLSLFAAQLTETPDMQGLRRDFDIFYSRITTLEQSTIYAPLRALPTFANSLAQARAFLDSAVVPIDASDAVLRDALPALQDQAEQLRPAVRRLTNSALEFFARESDARRNDIAATLLHLAIGIAALLLTLLLLVAYLGFLNAQNIRRRAQVIEASERMNLVTGTSLDGVIISDATGKILEYNAAAEQMFGIAAAEALGRDLGKVVVPEHHRAAHEAGMERMRLHGERRVVGKGRVRLDAQRANGEAFPIELAIQSAETRDGEIFVAFLRDISYRVRAEEQLTEARDKALAGEKAKTEFLATMSHEIRTPLNGLLGNLSLLRDTDLDSRQAHFIGNMESSGKLLTGHISDVLDITKYDAGKLEMKPTAMNLGSLMEDIIRNQSGAASANGTDLSWRWDGPRTDWIYADEERLQHILMNLVGNAVKFTPRGAVDVALRHADGQLTIIVHDTGIGIPPEKHERIFEDFVTGDSSYNRATGGTGLGLGITRRFVTALGGTIDLQSAEGVGSTFTVRVPVRAVDAPVRKTDGPAVRAEGPKMRILLVEDNGINREVAGEMLRAEGHDVVEAHDGAEAVRIAATERFDLILMDISMPVMDGRTATRTIRSGSGASSDTPIIALTANAMPEEQEAFLQAGMSDVLTKPLSREALRNVLNRQDRADVASTGVVSQAHLSSLRETLGPDGADAILRRFAAEVDQTLGQFTAEPAPALDDVARAAHRVAGSAATIGAMGLRAGLIAVEEAAKNRDDAAVAQAIAQLPPIWEATRRQLDLTPSPVAADPADD